VRRRDFFALIGAAAAAWPLAARAQQAMKLPTIGLLGSGAQSVQGNWANSFARRLRDIGWIEGQTIAIEYRWAEGRRERFEEIAAEFVRLNVDIIVTTGGAVFAVKQATSIIPTVFVVMADPVGAGVVESLARPGGNVTGLSNQSAGLAGKRLELLREVVPSLRRIAVLVNVGYPGAVLEVSELHPAARTLGLETIMLEIQRAEEIVPAFETLKGRANAVYVVGDPLVNSTRAQIHTLTVSGRMPAIYNTRDFVEAGGMMSYGPNIPDLFRRAAEMVDKILHGAKPANIPVEQPTKFEFVVNLTTAKALGITVPPSLLARADEVIE
jgi:ABC-type uncharacterized transport system substrate-binding protein